jgi:hypothetical protein
MHLEALRKISYKKFCKSPKGMNTNQLNEKTRLAMLSILEDKIGLYRH